MFKCQNCGKQIGPHTTPTMVVTKQRKKVYPKRYAEVDSEEEGKEGRKETVVIDEGGTGFETVEEIGVCELCVPKMGAPVIVPSK